MFLKINKNLRRYYFSTLFDVVVIGGGHAGCEAAYASARTGAKTMLITQKISTIGQMSCNPSMGGIGKGHLIRQIDALGGLVGKISDLSAFQYKVLNLSRGQAVQGPRQQVDRNLYKKHILEELQNTPNLQIKQLSVQDLRVNQQTKRIQAIISKEGVQVLTKNVVITTGTFLRGMIHMGKTKYPAGRHIRNSSDVQPPSIGLANTLKRLNFPINRSTTGTPPRLDAQTIDFSVCQPKTSDLVIQPFSFVHQWQNFVPPNKMLYCYMTQTNKKTHEVIQKYRHLLPTFQGNEGKGQGPRYCPAIQKKVIRFPQKKAHQIWLQPETLIDNVIYPNGLNNGFPQDVQLELVRTIKGLQNARMIRPGYAIQYDYMDPKKLQKTLRSMIIPNLYLAGQINGTTGYEQAAAQGIIAGLNAGLNAIGKQQYTLQRTNSYIGVLIDDLTSMGVSEPYRMFTSRSEYRIILRAQNADMRLTSDGIKLGIISKKQKQIFQEKFQMKRKALEILQFHNYSFLQWKKLIPKINDFSKNVKPQKNTAAQLISSYFPNITISDLISIKGIQEINPKIYKNVQVELKYQAQSVKMFREIIELKKHNQFKDISSIPYQNYKIQFTGEQYEKLMRQRPKTIFSASRIPGIRPTTLLYLHYLQLKHC